MTIAAILVAAGSGSRFGVETPKQFLLLAGRPGGIAGFPRKGGGDGQYLSGELSWMHFLNNTKT